MLITVEDYKRITGKTLADVLGYELVEHEVIEIKEYRKTIYLSHRPVNEIKKVGREEQWRKGMNYIEFPKFRECPCCMRSEEVEITYTVGYKELPDWLKFEIVGLVDDFINSFDEEISKYTSYKIDDIAYSMRDMLTTRNDKLNNIARLIYG